MIDEDTANLAARLERVMERAAEKVLRVEPLDSVRALEMFYFSMGDLFMTDLVNDEVEYRLGAGE